MESWASMSKKNMDILMVDNEPDMVEIRMKWLQEDGYRSYIVTTLSGAWEFIEDYVADNDGMLPLVLLDIMMPIFDDLDWVSSGYERDNMEITAPTAGLVFAEKLQEVYPDIKISWHSVREGSEVAVTKQIKKLGFAIVQKDLQGKTEFLKEIKVAYKL